MESYFSPPGGPVLFSLSKLFLLCLAGFLASWVDSIAGGGGIISLPAFLLAGLPPHLALGTNKLAASFSSFTSSFRYFKSGKTNMRLLLILAPFTLLGSILGVKTILTLNDVILRLTLSFFILGVGCYTTFNRSLGAKNTYTGSPTKISLFLGIFFSFTLGFYDGFFGPGTGSFLMFMFLKLFGFDYIHASGNARGLNFVSNVTSLVTFILYGKVVYMVGFSVGFFMIIGAWVGSHMAIKNGKKIIKPLFATVTLAIAIKLLFDLF